MKLLVHLRSPMGLFYCLLFSGLTFSGPTPASLTHASLTCAEAMSTASMSLPSSSEATFIAPDGQITISHRAAVYGGQPVDTKKFRTPVILSENKAQFMIVDQFMHNGKFYKAHIPTDAEAIDKVLVQALPFPILPGVIAGHIQARFLFREGSGVRLEDENGQLLDEQISDFVISYEAALPPGASYNFLLGAVDANPLVGRLLSGSQKFSEGPDRIVKQYQLPLENEEKTALMEYFIKDAASIAMKHFYNTVTRNCTTKIFDGIDSLARFKDRLLSGELLPFLTEIGGDPVIGPALRGLLARFGNDLREVQSQKDEYEGKWMDFGTPQLDPPLRFPFAPGSRHPMSLVILTTDTSHLTGEQKIKLQVLKQEILASLPETFNMMLSSALSVGQDLQSAPQILNAINQMISTRFQSRLLRLNITLPEKPVGINILFTPFPSEVATDLRPNGLRASLPFAVVERELSLSNQAQILDQIKSELDQVDDHASEDTPAFLKKFSVRLTLQKENSKVETQILLGLQPQRIERNILNSQVHIQEVVIPDRQTISPLRRAWDRIRGYGPRQDPKHFVSMLLSHAQKLNEEPNENIQISFGADPEILASEGREGAATILPAAANRFVCWSGYDPYAPHLAGRLTSTPLSHQGRFSAFVNFILRARPITFSIMDLDMNLATMNINAVRLRVGIFGLRCLDVQNVNDQFRSEAAAHLQTLISRFGNPQISLPNAN